MGMNGNEIGMNGNEIGMNGNEIARSPKLRSGSFVGEANAPNLRDILQVNLGAS